MWPIVFGLGIIAFGIFIAHVCEKMGKAEQHREEIAREISGVY